MILQSFGSFTSSQVWFFIRESYSSQIACCHPVPFGEDMASLDEAEDVIVPPNQINFAPVIGHTKVCGNDFVTQAAQVQVRLEFAAFAGQQMFRLVRR